MKQWLPITTAPRDGSIIAAERRDGSFTDAYWNGRFHCWAKPGERPVRALHDLTGWLKDQAHGINPAW